MAMQVLYDHDLSDASHDAAILTLAKEINATWLRSKCQYDPSAPPPWQFDNQESLSSALSAVFPSCKPNDPKTDPLNALLPGHETLWRVSLRCFLEVTSRDLPGDEVSWHCILGAFVERPSMNVFLSHDLRADVSVKDIAREALRLHPPNRRIYSAYKDADGNQVLAAADIEGLKRKAEHWGGDALTFKPKRIEAKLEGKKAKEIELEALLPFAARPFVYPARRNDIRREHLAFGTAMVALITGVMVEMTVLVGDDKSRWMVVGDLPPKEVPVDTGR